jgi:O-acetyl-ADP-ribose deacetylase (regulator of RNase III)
MMIEAIGQRVDASGPGGSALSYRERMELRKLQLKPALNRAVQQAREAEGEADYARDAFATACVRFATGEGGLDQVEAAERAVEAAEREHRRWATAARGLDEARGTIRDASGNVIS